MILLMNVDNENPSEIEGTNTQIEGAGILDFELKGNTKQDSYTGKNMYEGSQDFSGTWNNSSSWVTDTNTYNGLVVKKKTGVWSGISKDINVESGKTYTFSLYVKSDTIRQVAIYLSGGTATTSPSASLFETTTSWVRYQIRFTCSVSGTIRARLENTSAGDTNYTYICGYQLEEGNLTEYEPYCGGIPSPNPDYPQPIEVVTGDNTINVHGKNLCNNNYLNLALNYLNNEIISDASSRTMYAKVPKNTDITISKTNVTNRFRVGLLNKIPEAQDTFYLAYRNDDSSTLTTTINTGNYEYVAVQYTNQSQNTNLMIEKGSTASDYEEYQSQTYPLNLGNIELCKIKTYQDYIYKENNKWYKHSEIGKIVLNGSENWNYGESGATGIISSSTQISSMLSGNYLDGLATYFHNDKSGKAKNSIRFGANSKNIYLYLDETEYTSANDVKAFLSTHNVKIYYVLATPTNTEITDTTLVEQLEAISNSALFDGVNYIDLNSDNLIGSYKITYSTWYEFEKILRSGYNINEDNDRITQKFANGHRKQFVSDYKDCIITLNLDTIDIDTTKEYLRQLKSGPYKYYSLENKEYKTAQFIIEKRPELQVNNSIGDNTEIDEYQVTLLRAGD